MPKLDSLSPSSAPLRIKGAGLTSMMLSVFAGIALGACGGDGGVSGTGGVVGAGGDVGSGGAPLGTGGAPSTGGVAASGGVTSTGGVASTGGAAAGGAASGGAPTGSGGAESGGAPGSGGGSGDTCEIGTTAGNEVLFIGESFVQASTIPEETSKLAREAGRLKAGEEYVDRSASGTWIGPGGPDPQIPKQYEDNANGVRFVLMDGGGNDCWQGGEQSHRNAALQAAEQLFQKMGQNGVEKVVYFFYPDPLQKTFPIGDLRACLDLLRPEMKALCDAQTAPTCHWLDLRDTWNGHDNYTDDGIHVAGPGNAPTAKAIFDVMVENCVAP